MITTQTTTAKPKKQGIPRPQSIPVGMVLGRIEKPSSSEIQPGTKNEFYSSLRKSQKEAVRIANSSMTMLLANDKELFDGGEMPPINVYKNLGNATGKFTGVSHAASAITRKQFSLYAKSRKGIRAGKKTIPSQRACDWPLKCDSGGRDIYLEFIEKSGWIVAKIKLIDGWWVVRLAGGSNYRRQIATVKNSIETNRVCGSSIRIDQFGRNEGKAILAIVCRIDPESPKTNGSTLRVSSGRDCLLSLIVNDGDRPYVITGDDIKQRLQWFAIRQTRIRQDRKTSADKERCNEQSRELSSKRTNLLKSSVHEFASRVIKFATSRRAGKITLDLTIKSFIGKLGFPWRDLEDKIREKAVMTGIEVESCFIPETATADTSQPGIYFTYNHAGDYIKIGKCKSYTSGGESSPRSQGSATYFPGGVLLAYVNVEESQLTAIEKYYLNSKFDNPEFRLRDANGVVIGRKQAGNELRKAEPVIEYLRAAGLLGNTGNLSQISQVLDASQDALRAAHLKGDGDGAVLTRERDLSQEADYQSGIMADSATAPEVSKTSFGD